MDIKLRKITIDQIKPGMAILLKGNRHQAAHICMVINNLRYIDDSVILPVVYLEGRNICVRDWALYHDDEFYVLPSTNDIFSL